MHIKTVIQYFLPHHLLSRMVGILANCRWKWLKNLLIKLFCHRYNINLSEALSANINDYDCFNSFFTRELKPDARTIDNNPNSIISPIDGAISQFGAIDNNNLIQAKGKSFTLAALLTDALIEYFTIFNNGMFATLYLSPADYHRVHMPFTGKLLSMTYVPGRIYSVNPLTTNDIDQLYAKNERVIAIFETAFGPMAVVFVGAMLVASIKTVWHGIVTPTKSKQITTRDYQQQNISFNKGDEIGRFQFGSTIILLLPQNSAAWAKLDNNKIRLGETLATTN